MWHHQTYLPADSRWQIGHAHTEFAVLWWWIARLVATTTSSILIQSRQPSTFQKYNHGQHSEFMTTLNCTVAMLIHFPNRNKATADITLYPGPVLPLVSHAELTPEVHFNAARGGMSHVHRQHTQKIWWILGERLVMYAHGQKTKDAFIMICHSPKIPWLPIICSSNRSKLSLTLAI